MENIYYLVLLCVGGGTSVACIFFTICGCYHYIRNLNIANEKDSKAEAERPLLIASLRVDKEITMGLVSDVKTELRKAGQLKINYSATARSGALK